MPGSTCIALLNRFDEDHESAVRAAQSLKSRVVTSHFVLLEVLNACAQPAMRRRALSLVCSLPQDAAVTVAALSARLLADGIDLYRRRPDKGWSLTDCTSFVIMQRRRLRATLTADHHFTQAGFAILMT